MGANFCSEDTRQIRQQKTLSRRVGTYKYLKGENVIHTRKDIIPNQYLTNDLDNLINQLTRNNHNFVDADFAPGQLINCKWVRATKVIKGESNLYSQPNPQNISIKDDALQYFGVFLSFIAKNPSLIHKVILTIKNSYGLYLLKSYKADQGTILIDDLILCNQREFPIFTQPQKNSIWTMIMQKGWMKANNNNLMNIQNLSPDRPINEFLCIPTKKINIISLNQSIQKKKLRFENFKQFFMQADNQTYYYAFKSKKFDPNTDQIIGIRDLVYYSYIGNFIHDGKIFFLLRNPLGHFNYRGRWAGINQQIRTKLKKKLGYLDLKPGNFVIDQQQILQYFESVRTVYYRQGYIPNIRKFTYQSGQQFFCSFKIKTSGKVAITIIQDKSIQKSEFMIDLINISNFQQVTFGSRQSYLPEQYIHFFDDVMHTLTPGVYLIRIKSKQITSIASKSAQIAVYANLNEKIEFDIKNQSEFKNQFQEYLQRAGKQQFEQSKKIIKKPYFDYVIKWFMSDNQIANRAVIYIKNKKKKYHQLEFEFNQIKNLQCVSHEQFNKNLSYFSHKFDKEIQMIVFQKKLLHLETLIGEHSIYSQ